MATARKRSQFERAARLRVDTLATLLTGKAKDLTTAEQRLNDRATRAHERRQTALDNWSSRLAPSLARLLTTAIRDITRDRDKLAALTTRLHATPTRRLSDLQSKLDQLDRTRQSLGHSQTLKRGFAIVRGDGHVVTTKANAERSTALEIEFADGKLTLGPRPTKKTKQDGPDQGSLF